MTGPVCPPTVLACSIQSPNGTTGPTASYAPVVRASAASSSQPARSRASMTWLGASSGPGTSIGPSGSRAARATQYPDRPLWSPGPPIRPARAISSRSPTTDAVLCSQATFASPYCSMPASCCSVAGSNGVVSSASRMAFEA
jgi:hypothetical protein